MRDDALMGMDDLPDFCDLSVNDLEELVKGRYLTHQLAHYLGHCHRLVNLRPGFTLDEPGSACLGYIPIDREPIPEADLQRMREWGREVVREYEAGLNP